MDCQEYQQKISMLIDGELSDSQVEAVETHISTCANCRSVHERMIALDASVLSFAAVKPRSGLAEVVKERLRGDRQPKAGIAILPLWARVPLIAVITLLAVGLGSLAGSSLSEILSATLSDEIVAQFLPYQSPSFADALSEISAEENGR